MMRIGWPLCLLSVAIVCRVIFFIELRQAPTYQHPEGGDSILYDKVAAGAPEPPRAYFHSPLYQSFLGGLYGAFGRDLTLVRVVQHMAGCLMVLLVWVTTRRLFGSRAIAGIAGVAVAACGPLVFVEGQLVPDALMPCLVAAIPAMLLAYAGRPRGASAAVLGAIVALAALGRGVALAWAPLLAAWLWRGGGPGQRRGWHALSFVAAIAIAIAPVTLHNYRAEGEFVLLTANGGLNLYIGNNPEATGAYVLPDDLLFEPGDPMGDYAGFSAATADLGHRPSSSELSSWWSRRALRHIADSPGGTLALVGTKLKILVNDYEYPQLYNYYAYQSVCPILRILPTAGWVIMPGLVGLGLCLGRRRSHARLVAGLAIVYAASFVPFFVVDRYRSAWLPLLAPFAAMALAELWRAFRAGGGPKTSRTRGRTSEARRRWAIFLAGGRPKTAALVLALALGAAATFVPIRGPTRAAQYVAFGEATVAKGDTRGALTWYERALEDDPDHPRALTDRGIALARLGRLVEAEASFRRVVELRPSSERGYNNLGLAYMRLGRPAEAEDAFRTAIRLDPTLGEAYANLGDLLLSQGDRTQAADAFHSALKFLPKGTSAHSSTAARLTTLTDL